MLSLRQPSRKFNGAAAPAFAALLLAASLSLLSTARAMELPNPQSAAPQVRSAEPVSPSPQQQAQQGQDSQVNPSPPQEQQAPAAAYDKAIFRKSIPSSQLAFLNQFAGAPSDKAFDDKQVRKLMHSVVPGWMFHYGRDMSISDALDMVIGGSRIPVQVRGGRYVVISGQSGPYLMGRGFLWIDMQDGIAVGGFYFRPTNGEPTPTVTIFSKQVKEDTLTLGQLPPAFAEDFRRWAAESRVPALTTRYFIGDLNKRILLEHDEDFCSDLPGSARPPADDCQQTNADAADLDMNTAYYLDQVHYATNATAWMINDQDEGVFIRLRDSTCRVGPDPLACHIRLTRQHTHGIIKGNPTPHPPNG
jgi:hypothetical protein